MKTFFMLFSSVILLSLTSCVVPVSSDVVVDPVPVVGVYGYGYDYNHYGHSFGHNFHGHSHNH